MIKCDTTIEYDWDRFLWIQIIVLIFSVISAYFSWKYLFDILYITKTDESVTKRRRLSDDIPTTFALITLKNEKYNNSLAKKLTQRRSKSFIKVKPELTSFAQDFKRIFSSRSAYTINKWNILCLVGNLLQSVGVCIYLTDYKQRLVVTNVFFGLGCFFAWLNIGRYLEYNPRYFIVFKTLFASLPTTARFLLGNFPLFMGYAFLGTCIFWRSERFNSVSRSMVTEFALFLGDSVFDIFREISEVDFWLAQLYLCTFLILFFTIVQNFFISIVQFAYFSFEDMEAKRAKLHQRLHSERVIAHSGSFASKVYESKEEELKALKKEVCFSSKIYSCRTING